MSYEAMGKIRRKLDTDYQVKEPDLKRLRIVLSQLHGVLYGKDKTMNIKRLEVSRGWQEGGMSSGV
jgi:hypothetical protein